MRKYFLYILLVLGLFATMPADFVYAQTEITLEFDINQQIINKLRELHLSIVQLESKILKAEVLEKIAIKINEIDTAKQNIQVKIIELYEEKGIEFTSEIVEPLIIGQQESAAETEQDVEQEESEETDDQELEDEQEIEQEQDEQEQEQEQEADTESVESGGSAAGAPSSEPEPELDSTSPGAITNLAALNPTISSIDLGWTSPGNDENSGTAASYDIRYSTTLINSGNWGLATSINNEPVPLIAGSFQSITISGLSYSTTYYFAIKTSDEVPNESGLSNIISLTTNEPEDCSRPIASGARIYTTSTRSIPRITQIEVDPLDVNLGAVQTVTVEANDANGNPISLVSGSGGTDSSSVPFSLSLVDGDELDGTWQGSWSPQHTFCDNYTVGITVTSASGESNVTLTFR